MSQFNSPLGQAGQAEQVGQDCPDCPPASRRAFLRGAVGLAAATAASAGLLDFGAAGPRRAAFAAEAAAGSAPAKAATETLVAQLYKSLKETQRQLIAFPFDHPLRSKVDNNWHIIDKRLDQVFNRDQQALVRDIFMSMHSEEYADKVMKQVEQDNQEDGGFGGCAVALFGEPGDAADGKSKFEFVLTGRHVTRRCDGNSVEGEAFGGPIFCGHAAQGFNEKPDHPGNVYWYQAKRANELFQGLDAKHREVALLSKPREERKTETVKLKGKSGALDGLPVSELSRDQKELMRKVMADLLAPFRQRDADEAMKLIEAGGFDDLHIAFYNGKGLDIGNDGVWDVWQIEGPSMVWYFRGAPHVHTWVHVREPAKA